MRIEALAAGGPLESFQFNSSLAVLPLTAPPLFALPLGRAKSDFPSAGRPWGEPSQTWLPQQLTHVRQRSPRRCPHGRW